MTTSSNRPECESIQELMPEYALGSLLPDEAESVKDHARVCSVCHRELGAYELVVDGLLVSPAPIAPASLLRDRVMRAAGVVPVLTQRTRDGLGFGAWLSSILSPAGGLGRLSSAVAVVALLVAVGAAFQSQQLQSDLTKMQVENQSLRSATEANRLVFSDALRPGAIVWQLRGTESAPTALASLYCRPEGRTGLLSATNLQPLPEGEAYQLWLIRDGQRTSGGMLTVNSSGRGYLVVEAPEPFGEYQGVGMTVEPAGGSPSPTGQRVLAGQIY